MSSLGARVRQIREDRCLTQEQLADAIGLKRDTISRLESGKAKQIEVDALPGLVKVLKANPVWLLTGEGEPYAGGAVPVAGLATAGELVPEIIEQVDLADALEFTYNRTKELLARRDVRPIFFQAEMQVIGDGEAIERAEGANWADQFVAVPLMRDEAAAGMGREIADDAVDGYCVIYRAWVDQPEFVRCLRVRGDSMTPILAEGSIVAVDVSQCLAEDQHGKLVAALTDDGVTIKWLEVAADALILRPQNLTHRSIVLQPDDGNPIIGRVVWAWTVFR